jgi:hypothetical protein
MDAGNHPDPVREAVGHARQRAVQFASVLGASAQTFMYLRGIQARSAAERDDRVRRALQAQIRAERDAARAGWAPALDPEWLRRADLLDVGRTWGQALPYADRNVPWHQPAATAALRNSEERLRDLHPYAMAWYDRLRASGVDPVDAMREALPLFTRHPRPQDAPSVPRLALDNGNGTGLEWAVNAPDVGADGAQATVEARGRQIAAALQARARKPLEPAELRFLLESVTNLPDEVIERITAQGESDSRPADSTEDASPANGPAANTRPGKSIQPWQREFPIPIRDVVAAAAPSPSPSTNHPSTTRATRPSPRS